MTMHLVPSHVRQALQYAEENNALAAAYHAACAAHYAASCHHNDRQRASEMLKPLWEALEKRKLRPNSTKENDHGTL